MKQLQRVAAFSALCVSLLAWGACKNNTEEKKENTSQVAPPKVDVPAFNADSAYAHVATQVAFGPRVPGTKAQQQCAQWITAALKQSCDTVYVQSVSVTAGNGKQLPCINIIGAINPQATRRILFLTHWDSRPWADQDTKDQDKPILAADDGGSGTAVLIEMARILKEHKIPADLGIDLLCTDVEDYGKSEWGENSYCLGTQYWSAKPHLPGYRAEYGILLDMVGGSNAQFPMEGLSTRYAGDVQQRVWQAAATAGYSSFFPYAPGPDITDDHIPVNEAGIRTVDVIHLRPDPSNPFPAHWHTHADAMEVIDRNTLKAVGQTMLQVIYEEAAAGANATAAVQQPQ